MLKEIGHEPSGSLEKNKKRRLFKKVQAFCEEKVL